MFLRLRLLVAATLLLCSGVMMADESAAATAADTSVAEADPAGAFDYIDEGAYRNPDPWVKVNRPIHNVNNFVDKILIRPVARGYRKIMPRFAQAGVRNFFGNLRDVNDAVNNVAQGKFGRGVSDLARITVNTTVGIGGLFDPATTMGLEDHNEDWGQTFAVWGIPAGPYIVIPGLGPSTVRDGMANFLNGNFLPLRYYYPVSHRNTLYALDQLQSRTDVLGAEGVVFGDRYLFLRDAYLQRREYLINDGETEADEFDDFDDF